MKQLGIYFAIFGMAAALSACGRHEKPNFTFMPDMAYSPAYKAQEVGSIRVPPAGTVARGFQSYAFKGTSDPLVVGKELKNPLKRTRTVLQRGQDRYNTYCIACHGPAGEGDGTIVPKFPRPPSLQSDKILGYADGSIYHVISNGQNLMPSYATQIDPQDRWAIIHYLRVLQKSKHPTLEDLKRVELLSKKESK